MKYFDYFDTVYEGIECTWDAFRVLIDALWYLCVLPVIVILVVLLYAVLFPFWLIGKCKNERL
jgi:hypothetical protein